MDNKDPPFKPSEELVRLVVNVTLEHLLAELKELFPHEWETLHTKFLKRLTAEEARFTIAQDVIGSIIKFALSKQCSHAHSASGLQLAITKNEEFSPEFLETLGHYFYMPPNAEDFLCFKKLLFNDLWVTARTGAVSGLWGKFTTDGGDLVLELVPLSPIPKRTRPRPHRIS